MTSFLRIPTLLVCWLSLSASGFAQEPPDSLAIAEANRLGELLHLYDQAAWHGTDAVMPMLSQAENLGARVHGYVVKRVQDGWRVAFGRLTPDGSAFAVAYEAELDDAFQATSAQHFTEAELRTGFFRYAMAARDSAIARFTPPEQVTYNTAVIPASDEHLYVYLLPAQPDHNVYYLGGDFRYRFDLAAGVITEEKRLHNAMLTMDLRHDVPLASFATAVLTEVPTETDVLYARSRPEVPGGANHYVMTEDWVFMLDHTGVMLYMTKEAFGALGDAHIDE